MRLRLVQDDVAGAGVRRARAPPKGRAAPAPTTWTTGRFMALGSPVLQSRAGRAARITGARLSRREAEEKPGRLRAEAGRRAANGLAFAAELSDGDFPNEAGSRGETTACSKRSFSLRSAPGGAG